MWQQTATAVPALALRRFGAFCAKNKRRCRMHRNAVPFLWHPIEITSGNNKIGSIFWCRTRETFAVLKINTSTTYTIARRKWQQDAAWASFGLFIICFEHGAAIRNECIACITRVSEVPGHLLTRPREHTSNEWDHCLDFITRLDLTILSMTQCALHSVRLHCIIDEVFDQISVLTRGSPASRSFLSWSVERLAFKLTWNGIKRTN